MTFKLKEVVIPYIVATVVGMMVYTSGLAIILGRHRVLIQSVSPDRARGIQVVARPDFGYPTFSSAADIVAVCKTPSGSSIGEVWIAKVDLVEEGEGCFVCATWDADNCILTRRGGVPWTVNTKDLTISKTPSGKGSGDCGATGFEVALLLMLKFACRRRS